MFVIGELHGNLSEVVTIQIPEREIQRERERERERNRNRNRREVLEVKGGLGKREKEKKIGEKMKLFGHVGNSSSPAV